MFGRLPPWAHGWGAAITLMLVISACVGLAQQVARAVVKETLDEQLAASARVVAQQINIDLHAQLTEPAQENGELYSKVVAPLRGMLSATPEFKYIYTMRQSPEGLRFVVDAADPTDADGDGVLDQAVLGELYDDPDPAMLEAIATRTACVSPQPKTDKWGTFISAFAPLFRPDGTFECLVGVDTTATQYLSRLSRINRAAVLALAVGALASWGLGFVVFLHQRWRQAADHRLASSESLLREMGQAARVGGWSLDIATKRIEWTEQTRLIHEVPEDFVLTLEAAIDFYAPECRQLVADSVAHATQTGEPWDLELPLITAKGRLIWVRVVGRAEMREGKAVRLYGAFQDITAKRDADQELQAATNSLEEAESVARMGNWTFDLRSGKVSWSRQVFKLFGRNEADGPPDFAGVMSDYHPQDARLLEAAVKRAAADGTPYTLILRTSRPESGIKYIRGEGRARRDQTGAIIGLFGTATDVTADIEREEALHAARNQAEAANRAKSEFLANMSHEIRTPLTAILGYVELLDNESDRAIGPAERAEYVGTIRRNGEHLLTVINDILDLSKIEAGRMTIERLPINPAEVLLDVESLMRERASAKKISLTFACGTAIPKIIHSDAVRLKQILVNLVGNAIKFTETGGVKVTAKARAGADNEYRLEISVADTGIGMKASQLSQLFNAFTQADASMTRRFGGTGLGLRISKSLAQILGGDIAVSSEPGKGSEFVLRISTGTFAGAEMSDPTGFAVTFPTHTNIRAAMPPGSLAGVRIFFAEDGPDNQRLIHFHLSKAGAQVRVFDNGMLAIEALTTTGKADGPLINPAPCDLLLTDMQMPVMDGYTLASVLRARGCILPIIALTAHAMDGDASKCIAAGCDDYATKPIDRFKLIEVCTRAIRGVQTCAMSDNGTGNVTTG